MNNKLKYLIPIFAVCFILTSLIIVFSSWILTLSTNIGSEEIETIYDPTLENYTLENSFDYDKTNKYPHINLGDKFTDFNSKYSVEYFRKSVDGKLTSTTITINAGTYVARYFNTSSRIYTDYEYIIKPISPNLECSYSNSDRQYYSPTLGPSNSDFVCTGYYGDGVLSGTITYTKNLTNEGTITSEDLSLKITCVFKPTNQNYSSAVYDLFIPLYAVARINTAYFSRIETALESALPGNEIRIIIGTNPTIYEDCVVKSDVVLHLNYSTDSVNKSTATYPISDENSTIPALNLCNSVKLNDNKTITIASGGTLEIGGELGASNPCGRTVGNYSELIMGSSSKIICNGTIDCYGFITEKTKDNSSLVEIQNGDLYLPFIVYDFKGGSITYGIYDKFDSAKCPPFNEFGLSNIHSELTLYYNSNVYGYANLYAGSQHNPTVISLVGNTSSDLIQMTSSTFSYIKANYDEVLDQLFIDMYGGAEINSMSITITVLGTMTISTNQVYFPITFRQQITMNANSSKGQNIASYSMNQRYKLMPGALLQVNENVVLEATSLCVYKEKDYTVTTSVAGHIYPSDKGDAQLIINGELHVGDIGGVVSSCKEGAFLFINTGTNIPIREVVSSSGSLFWTTVTFTDNSVNALINTYQEEKVPLESTATIGIYECKSYSYNGTKYYYWDQYGSDEVNMYTIKYVTNSEDTILSDRIVYSLDSSIILNEIVLPDSFSMIKKGYQFNGWFIDSNLTTPADNYNLVNSEITVYASWIIKNYSIGYESIVENSEEQIKLDISGITDSLQSEYNINSEKPNLPELVIEGYDFLGWYYYDESEPIPYDTFTVALAMDVIFIARFKVAEKPYEIKYQLINSENSVIESNTLVSNLKDISSFNINDYISNIKSKYNNDNTSSRLYFEGYNKTDGTGWYIDSSLSNPYVSLTSDMVTDASGDYQIITLYGKLLNKISITYDSSTVFYYIPGAQCTAYDPGDNSDSNIHMWENKDHKIFVKYGGLFIAPSSNTVLSKVKFIKVTLSIDDAEATLTSTNGRMITSSFEIITSFSTAGSCYFEYLGSNQSSATNITVNATYDWKRTDRKTTISSGSYTVSNTNGNREVETTGTIHLTSAYTVKVSANVSCFTSDTLITLADGSQKRVDELKGSEKLLVWNHHTGKFEASSISIFAEHDKHNIYHNVLTLIFSNNHNLKIIGEHALFNATLNKYVDINVENIDNYIGHEFIFNNNLTISKTILISYENKKEYTKAWGITSDVSISCFANGFLQANPFNTGALNAFDIDKETLMYINVQDDINKYGLYTYDEFKDYISYYEFNALKLKYFKISINKGYITNEEILFILTYLKEHSDEIYYPNE